MRANKSPLFQKKFPSCALQDFLQKLLSQEDDLIWAQCAQGSSGRNPWMVLKMIIFTNASNCFNVGAILAQHSLVIPASSRLWISRVKLVMMRKDVTNWKWGKLYFTYLAERARLPRASCTLATPTLEENLEENLWGFRSRWFTRRVTSLGKESRPVLYT